MASADLSGFFWLVTTYRGVFAVAEGQLVPVLHGWFFGICHHDGHIYIYENCGHGDRSVNMGRIIRLGFDRGVLTQPQVLVTGLDGNAHQLKVISDHICLVDTANQRILRFALSGAPVDSVTPFPVAPNTDTSGAYMHLNCLAEIDGRIGLMLHNGKAVPAKRSEIAWFDYEWKLLSRIALDGHQCHDIVNDPDGVLWHSDSMAGDLIANNGRRLTISPDMMTRGIAFAQDKMLVGLTRFANRAMRDVFSGEIVILNEIGEIISRMPIPSGPTDAISLA